MPAKKKVITNHNLTFSCSCGSSSEFSMKSTDTRTFFGGTEQIQVGEMAGFTLDLFNPANNSFEIYCRKCGTVYRINNKVEPPR